MNEEDANFIIIYMWDYTFLWIAYQHAFICLPQKYSEKAVHGTANRRDKSSNNCLFEPLLFSFFFSSLLDALMCLEIYISRCPLHIVLVEWLEERLLLFLASVELRWNGSSCVNSSWWSPSPRFSAPWRHSWLSRAPCGQVRHTSPSQFYQPGASVVHPTLVLSWDGTQNTTYLEEIWVMYTVCR